MYTDAWDGDWSVTLRSTELYRL